MKTKIIYISGNEIFNMADIRAAFDEVRNALNLDKNTVLFGVPVDNEDAGLMKTDSLCNTEMPDIAPEPEIPEIIQDSISTTILSTENNEPEIDQPIKKRGRPRKETIIDHEEETHDIIDNDTSVEEIQEIDDVEEIIKESDEVVDVAEERVVPILSVLSTKEDAEQTTIDTDDTNNNVEIIHEANDEIVVDERAETGQISDDEDSLEKLLSEMTPLQEDILEGQNVDKIEPEIDDSDVSVDATLEQLATEFAEKQDKILSENKSTSRSKIGKLRNILPFKQSKHKDQGLGDLFGWAGIAANDEDFSVPGFFTSAASKK